MLCARHVGPLGFNIIPLASNTSANGLSTSRKDRGASTELPCLSGLRHGYAGDLLRRVWYESESRPVSRVASAKKHLGSMLGFLILRLRLKSKQMRGQHEYGLNFGREDRSYPIFIHV